jgi:hypothetical protein
MQGRNVVGEKMELKYTNIYIKHFLLNKHNAKYTPPPTTRTRGVSHCGLAIYIKKYLKKAKEELSKLKYFTMQKYNLPKNKNKILSKKPKNPSRYLNSRTDLKFQHKPKKNKNIIMFQKFSYENRAINYYLRAKIPLSLYYITLILCK